MSEPVRGISKFFPRPGALRVWLDVASVAVLFFAGGISLRVLGPGLTGIIPLVRDALFRGGFFGRNLHFVVKGIGRLIGHVRLLPYFDAGSAIVVRAGDVPRLADVLGPMWWIG